MDDRKKFISKTTKAHAYRKSGIDPEAAAAFSDQKLDEFSKTLFDDAFDAIIIFDPETEHVYNVNKRASEIYGYKRSEFVGMCLKDISVNPDLGEDRIRDVLVKKKLERFETTQIRKNGSQIILEINASVIDYQGQKAILSINRDITDRKRTDEALRESEETYRTLFEQSGDFMVLEDRNEEIVDVNKKACEILGYSHDELLKMKTSELEIPACKKHPDRIPVDIYKNTSHSGSLSIEREIQTKKGEIKHLEISIVPLIMRGEPLFMSIARDVTSRKKAERELRESEKKYFDIFEGASDGIIYSDKLGKVLDVNSKFEAITGLNEDDVVGKSAFTLARHFVQLADLPKIIKLIKRKLSGDNDTTPLELNYRDKVLEIAAHSAKGRLGVTGIIRDVTERKNAEIALKENQQMLRMVIDLVPHLIFAKNREGKYLLANKAIADTYGTTVKELIGKHDRDFSKSSKEAEQFRFDDLQVIRTGEAKLIPEEKMTDSRGRERIMQTTKIPFKIPGSNEIAVMGVSIDVTERRLAEKSLRESEERYRQLFDNDLTGDYVTTPDGEMITCNRAFLRIFGFKSLSEAISTPVADLYPNPHERDQFIELLMKDGKIEFYEKNLRHRDGHILRVIENAMCVRDASGKIIQIRGNIMDNTRRKELEEQLRQAQKMEGIGRLAGGIAHDFNNLLTVIQGNTELSLLSLDESDPLYEDINEIQFAANRASELTRQLLAFSRQQTMQPRVIDLNEVITNMHRMLVRMIGEDIRLTNHPAKRLWSVKVDPMQIEQVIVNLVVNARDAMQSGGTLTIETSNQDFSIDTPEANSKLKSGQYVMMAISDNGPGIPEELQSKIFDPFFTTKETGKGTGLGLSMVYGIIKQSRGYIDVYSEVGKGTTFKIYLPREESEAEGLKKVGAFANLPTGKEKILIVEDEKSVRTLAARILTQQGYQVCEAESGKKALKMCEESGLDVDLILSDVIMPDLNGPDFIELVRKRWPGIKAIFMSGYASDHIVEDGLLDPDTPYMQKPFSPFALAVKVRDVLDDKL